MNVALFQHCVLAEKRISIISLSMYSRPKLSDWRILIISSILKHRQSLYIFLVFRQTTCHMTVFDLLAVLTTFLFGFYHSNNCKCKLFWVKKCATKETKGKQETLSISYIGSSIFWVVVNNACLSISYADISLLLLMGSVCIICFTGCFIWSYIKTFAWTSAIRK